MTDKIDSLDHCAVFWDNLSDCSEKCHRKDLPLLNDVDRQEQEMKKKGSVNENEHNINAKLLSDSLCCDDPLPMRRRRLLDVAGGADNAKVSAIRIAVKHVR